MDTSSAQRRAFWKEVVAEYAIQRFGADFGVKTRYCTLTINMGALTLMDIDVSYFNDML
jgi:hypothetical protein